MISAEEAAKLASEKISKDLEAAKSIIDSVLKSKRLFEKIEEAAKAGYKETEIDGCGFYYDIYMSREVRNHIEQRLKYELEQLGYKVTINVYSIEISWA